VITPRALLYVAGGAVFCVLGALHAVYMLMDLRRPRRLVPGDPALLAAMSDSRVRLAGDATDMWRAWVGFNLSHSLGALLFGAMVIAWPVVSAGHDALAWLRCTWRSAYASGSACRTSASRRRRSPSLLPRCWVEAGARAASIGR